MDDNLKAVTRARAERAVKALEKNHIPAVLVPDRGAAVKVVETFLNEGETISCGGSMTLGESGILDLMKSGNYHFIDRTAMDPREAYLQTFSADVFLTSANAITENGELYNVDGNGNRVAALIYGPKRVIVVAGINKLVRDLGEAVLRVKETAAPANGKRLKVGTPCAETGRCAACGGEMTAGCRAESRMCCQYVVTGYQRSDRIRVILVEEELGY